MYSPLNPLLKARLVQQKVENWKCVRAPCTHCARLLAPWWTVAHQAPLPMEFSGRKYWSGLPFPIPGCLPDPGIQPAPLASPALAGGFFSSAPPGKPRNWKDGMLFALETCFVLGFLFCCSYSENEFWNSGTLRKICSHKQIQKFVWKHKGVKESKSLWKNTKQTSYAWCAPRLPWRLSGKESACNRRWGFHQWVRKIPWRRKWEPTPVFLPGQCHGQRSLVGYSPWGHKRVGHELATKHQPALRLVNRETRGF